MSYFLEYKCPSCLNRSDLAAVDLSCNNCGTPLLAQYDLYRARKETQRLDKHSINSIWEYQDFLPFVSERNMLTMAEGKTPVYNLQKMASIYNVSTVLMKDESQNPSGSLRDREMSMLFSFLKSSRSAVAFVESFGTLAISASMYSSAADMQLLLLLPETYPTNYEKECLKYGSNVNKIEWSNEKRKSVRDVVFNRVANVFDTLKNGYTLRIEGAKTLFYEIYGEFHNLEPDVLVVPFGDGTLLMALSKAISELQQLGLMKRKQLPEVWVVQSNIYPDLRKNEVYQTNEISTDTIALDLINTNRTLFPLIQKSINQFNWRSIQISDEEMIGACELLASKEGFLPSLEGGACLSAILQITAMDDEYKSKSFVTINPSSGSRQVAFM